jgi:sulfur relay (sulfurtransferase) DsrC/TusE family protein
MEEKLKCLNAMDLVKDWDTWREMLGEMIRAAKDVGLTEEQLEELALKVGDFLASKVCPATKEEELIKQMWNSGTEEERRALASMIIKLSE